MTNYQLQIKSFVFGPFQTNCYVITNYQSPITNNQSHPSILLVDPACSNESEQQQLVRYIENLSPFTFHLSIIATHGHLDHLWGAAWACAKWNTPVLMHEADIPMAKAMQSQYDLFGIRATAEDFPIEPLNENNLSPFNSQFTIIHTPGHTPGSICLYFNTPSSSHLSPFILSGDTLFQMGYGRTDLPGGNFSQLIDSLDSLFALPSDVQVFPGHGEPTTIGAERD